MKTMISLFFVACLYTSIVWSLSDEVVIVDKKGVKVELTRMETKKINFDVGDFNNLTIPVAAISSIRLAEDGKTLILQLVTGRNVKGTSDSNLEGEWELGNYSVSLSDIKSVEFRWATQQQRITTVADLPEGYYASITDWTGRTMEVYNFEYRGRWYYSSPYINRSSHMSYLNRRYLPVEYKELIVGIPFSDIDVVKFTDVKSTDREWQPTLEIQLADRERLTAKLAVWGEYAPRFTGEVAQGDIIERIHQIDFSHKRDKNASRVDAGCECCYNGLNSSYTISIKTSHGNQVAVRNGTLIGLDEGHCWENFRTEFKIKFGESTTVVDFSKIKSILLTGESKAQMVTTSGKTVDILLLDYNEIWIGGNIDRFGPARIQLSKTSSLEINKTGE